MSIPYRAEVDGLRALAILAVVGYHAFPSVLPGGFIGVDIFFVISGYLITSILLKEQGNGTFSIRGFYGRRIIRILPALILVIIACLLGGWFLMLADEYKSLAKHALGGLGFISNFVLWQETGYFDKAVELKPFLNLWSLGIEEQFYIAWPLILLSIHGAGRSPKRIVWILASLSFAFSTWSVFYDKEQAFYSPLSRAWELLAGAVLAITQDTENSDDTAYAQWISSLSILTLIFSVFFIKSNYAFPGPLALLPVLSCVFLIKHSHKKKISTFSHHLLCSKPLVWIGLISYPLYLWHWPILSFSRILLGEEPDPATRILLVLTSIALAHMTYRLVEQKAKQLPRRFVITIILIASLLVATIAAHIIKKDGLERKRHRNLIQLSDQLKEDFIDFEKRGLIKEGSCDLPFIFPDHPNRQICLTGKDNQPSTALLIGDSHAVHAYWGLIDAFAAAGQNLKVTGRGACVPFMGYTSPNNRYECQPHVDQILKTVANTPEVKSVVLVFRGRYITSETKEEDYKKFLEAMDKRLLYSTTLENVYTFSYRL
jgi:peptidoglycan/LPS O-acetylase OafA/YrhL